MDLPIDDKELNTLVMITEKVKGDGLGKRDVDAEKLYNKLKLVKEVRDENPDGPYKRILREKHGMVI
tara:strand:- start:144 stop:344 length:201 start_codon:yes stop_codon:yes gene_type:complete